MRQLKSKDELVFYCIYMIKHMKQVIIRKTKYQRRFDQLKQFIVHIAKGCMSVLSCNFCFDKATLF